MNYFLHRDWRLNVSLSFSSKVSIFLGVVLLGIGLVDVVSASEFKFAKVEVEVEQIEEGGEDSIREATVQVVPTHIQEAVSQSGRVIIRRQETPIPDPVVVKPSEAAQAAHEASQKSAEGSEAKPADPVPPKPVLIAPLQGDGVALQDGSDGNSVEPFRDLDLNDGVLVESAANPYFAPYVQPKESAQGEADFQGMQVKRATPVEEPVSGLPNASGEAVMPPAAASAVPVAAAAPPAQAALTGDEGEEGYYSDLETDALLGAGAEWRFARPLVGSTW